MRFRPFGSLRAKESSRPECMDLGIGLSIDQLGVDADPVSRPLNTYRKLVADLLRVERLVPVGESVLREITSMPAIRDRSAVRSSVIASAKYCCSRSSLRKINGRTTMDRRGAAQVATADGAGIDCDKQRRQGCAMTKAKHHVLCATRRNPSIPPPAAPIAVRAFCHGRPKTRQWRSLSRNPRKKLFS